MTSTLDAGILSAGLLHAGVTSAQQQVFDDLGPPLHEVAFVVVDLETTGGSPADCAITEVGAVRTLGGVVTGEFQTLVNPGTPIPPFIASLTGITTAAVAGAPRIGAVLPQFLEFARGAVLVAHNARFDVAFLKAACAALDTPWPEFTVIDTARLARVLLHRDEVPNNKLATLARHFRSATTPDHRALTDARATVDVLHGLLGRAGDFGAQHLDDLSVLASRVRPDQRSKRTLAEGLPDEPGVYQFLAPDGRTLYVGKATSLRRRVRSYFTASETRSRIIEMVRIATRVEPIVCTSELEASVREVRLIAEHQPPYNRRSRHADRPVWLRLTDEAVPRLAVANTLGPTGDLAAGYLGPFPSRRAALRAAELLQLAHPLRTCTQRITRRTSAGACIRAHLGTCLAPCVDPTAWDEYADVAVAAYRGMVQDLSPVITTVTARLTQLAAAERYEEAGTLRNDLQSLLTTVRRGWSLQMLGRCPHLVAARPDGRDWVIHVVRHGRLAGTARARPHQDPAVVVAAAVALAEQPAPPDRGLTAATGEESQLVLKWLGSPGVRLVQLDGVLAEPLLGTEPTLSRLQLAATPSPTDRLASIHRSSRAPARPSRITRSASSTRGAS